MRILVLSQYWYPENGVPQRRWAWLTGVLTSAGHQVEVIAPSPHYKQALTLRSWISDTFRRANRLEEGPNGEWINRVSYLPFGTSITGRSINQGFVGVATLLMSIGKFRLKGEPRPDVIIGTVPALPTSWITMITSKAIGVPYVIDIRDVWPELLKENRRWKRAVGSRSLRERILSKGPLQVVIWLVERLISRSLKKSAAIITTSERHAEHLKRELGVHHPIVTIRNVFPPRSRTEERKLRQVEERPLRVVYAGTIGLAQNLNNVVNAYQLATASGTKIELKIIGAGVAFAALRDRVQTESIDVELIDQLPSHELGEYYQWADTALVHLTDWSSFDMAVPSKIFELVSNGIHITAAVEGEAAELIQKLHAGKVVSPEDPQELAQFWRDLQAGLSKCEVSSHGKKWVDEERAVRVPETLRELLAPFDDKGLNRSTALRR